MVNIIKQEIEIEEALKNKIEFICSFCNTTATILNGSIRTIEHTNLTYVEPHRIIIKDKMFLAFNYETRMFEGKKYDDAEVVRIFPLEEINKDKIIIDMGMISVKNDDVIRTETYEELFDTIPCEVNGNEYINYDKLEALEKIAEQYNMSDEEIVKTFFTEI